MMLKILENNARELLVRFINKQVSYGYASAAQLASASCAVG